MVVVFFFVERNENRLYAYVKQFGETTSFNKVAVQWRVAKNIMEKLRGTTEPHCAVLVGSAVKKVLTCPFVKSFGYACVLWECGGCYCLMFFREMNKHWHHWDWFCRELLSSQKISPVVFWGKEAIGRFRYFQFFFVLPGHLSKSDWKSQDSCATGIAQNAQYGTGWFVSQHIKSWRPQRKPRWSEKIKCSEINWLKMHCMSLMSGIRFLWPKIDLYRTDI